MGKLDELVKDAKGSGTVKCIKVKVKFEPRKTGKKSERKASRR